MPRQQHPRFHTHNGSKPIRMSVSPFDRSGVATITVSLSRDNDSAVQTGLHNSSVYIPKQFRTPLPGQRHSSPGECDLVLKIFPRLPLTREAPSVTEEGVLITSGMVSVCEQCKTKRASLFQLQRILKTPAFQHNATTELHSQRLSLADGEVQFEFRICCMPHHHTFLSDPVGYIVTFELYRGKQVLLTHTIENVGPDLSPKPLENVTGERTFPLRRGFPLKLNRPSRTLSNDTPAAPRPLPSENTLMHPPRPPQRRATVMSISHLVQEDSPYSKSPSPSIQWSSRQPLVASPDSSASNSPTFTKAVHVPSHETSRSLGTLTKDQSKLAQVPDRFKGTYREGMGARPRSLYRSFSSSSAEPSSPTVSSPTTSRSSPGPFSPTRTWDVEIERWRPTTHLRLSPRAGSPDLGIIARSPTSPTLPVPDSHHHSYPHHHHHRYHQYQEYLQLSPRWEERSDCHHCSSSAAARSLLRPISNHRWPVSSSASPPSTSGYKNDDRVMATHYYDHHHQHQYDDSVTASSPSGRAFWPSPLLPSDCGTHQQYHHEHQSAEYFHRPQPSSTVNRVRATVHPNHQHREAQQPTLDQQQGLHQQQHMRQQHQSHQQQPPLTESANVKYSSYFRGASPTFPPPSRNHSPLNDWSLLRGSIARSPSEASDLDQDNEDANDQAVVRERYLSSQGAGNDDEETEAGYRDSQSSTAFCSSTTSSTGPSKRNPGSGPILSWTHIAHRPSSARHHPYGHHSFQRHQTPRTPSPPVTSHSVSPRLTFPQPSMSRVQSKRNSKDLDDGDDPNRVECKDSPIGNHCHRINESKKERQSSVPPSKRRPVVDANEGQVGTARLSKSNQDERDIPTSPGQPPVMDAAIGLLQFRSAS